MKFSRITNTRIIASLASTILGFMHLQIILLRSLKLSVHRSAYQRSHNVCVYTDEDRSFQFCSNLINYRLNLSSRFFGTYNSSCIFMSFFCYLCCIQITLLNQKFVLYKSVSSRILNKNTSRLLVLWSLMRSLICKTTGFVEYLHAALFHFVCCFIKLIVLVSLVAQGSIYGY